jgi:hypothetical protein
MQQQQLLVAKVMNGISVAPNRLNVDRESPLNQRTKIQLLRKLTI